MRRRVVIIDDSLDSRATLRKALVKLGFDVIGEGARGSEAIRRAQELEPDALFLAVGLPDMDGLSAAAQILEAHPLPIIILSGQLSPELVQRAKEAGVMAYMVKPLREEELLPAIELAVSRFEEFMALRKENADLKRTLEDRKLIERAKGVLIERDKISEQQAFARIQRASMNTRRPMAEIAQAILLSEETVGRSSERPQR
ncbi:MAG: ANTAR domain-containing protein [Candidatus Methylomirabilis oxyfera]|nr:ANTAR domain-containing protein [Candidatus Methylomirabilis oxyfera]